MFKKLMLTILFVSFCVLLSTTCFAYEKNPYLNRIDLNTSCYGLNGEKVEFLGNDGMSRNPIKLKIKNLKTKEIDLVLESEAAETQYGLCMFSVNQITLGKKSFWIVKEYEDGPKYFRTKHFWIIGEYKEKYIVFLTENSFGPIFKKYLPSPTYAKFKMTIPSIAFEYSRDQFVFAYWDDKANWFAYSNDPNFSYTILDRNGHLHYPGA